MNYTATTRQYLSGLTDMRYAKMVSCSDTIGRSMRIISRKLKSEGTDFKALVHEERKARILTAIANDPQILARELAEVCGVADGCKMRRLIMLYTGVRFAEFRLDAIRHMTAGSGLA